MNLKNKLSKIGTKRKTRNRAMPGGQIQTDMLSGIEEESDMYEGFAPHVDYANIPISNESSPGKFLKSCSE